MIFIDKEINEILTSSTGITSLVGDNIFRGNIPENTTNPVIQFGSAIGVKSRFKGGRNDKAVLTIKIYADSDNKCLEIAETVDNTLEGLQGVNDTTGFKINNIELITIYLPEEDVDGSNVRSLQYEIH